MSFTSGFFNALNHDRRYNALTVSSMFDGVMHDGIFSTIGECLRVKTLTGSDMRVYVGTGRAWFDHTWSLNDSKYVITIPAAHPLLPRIDAIVLEVNHEENVRANSIKHIQGAGAQSPARPALKKTEYVTQYPLAYIRVEPKVTAISQSKITNMVGTSATPFATAILDHITTDQLIEQWWHQFYEWWSQLEALLDGDVATNLANRILKMERLTTITIKKEDWAENWIQGYYASPVYEATVYIPNLRSSDNPELYSALEMGASPAEFDSYNQAFSILSSGASNCTDGRLWFQTSQKINRDLRVILKGV